MRTQLQTLTFALLALLAFGLLAGGCDHDDPVLVGFAGQLTGSQADLGVQGRNGAMLAVDTLNNAGGVAGRPLELVPVDDMGTPVGARAAVQELADRGAIAIIGHMTSGQSVAALPVAEERNMVLLSPTTSTTALEGKKDMFFRVQPVISSSARSLARHVRQELGLQRIGVVYDTDNQAYSEAYLQAFRSTFTSLGGELSDQKSFSASEKTNYLRLLARVMDKTPQGLLVIASAYDTAIIAQTYKRGGWQQPLFFSGWAQTDKLIYMGGEAVEGSLIASDFDPQNTNPQFATFRTRFNERFGHEPTFAAAQAYDAVMLLARALEQAGFDAEKLPKALTSLESFQGVSGEITLDEFGDVIKNQYLVTVRDGRFVTLGKVTQ